MNKLLALVLAALLPFSSALSEAFTMPALVDDCYTVGVDLAPGEYLVAANDVDYALVYIGRNNEMVGRSHSIGKFMSETSVVLSVEAGDWLFVQFGDVQLTPLDASAAADIAATDPLLNAIDGVDLNIAFDLAKSTAEAGDYPELYSLGLDYDDALKTISITIFLNDDADAETAKDYAAKLTRLLNTCCIYQNTQIAPSKPDYLGGIYDVVACTVLAARFSDFPDETKFLLYEIIPVGTQGWGTIDGHQLRK